VKRRGRHGKWKEEGPSSWTFVGIGGKWPSAKTMIAGQANRDTTRPLEGSPVRRRRRSKGKTGGVKEVVS